MTAQTPIANKPTSSRPSLQPADLPFLFADPSQDPVLNYSAFHLDQVRSDIDTVGFSIVKGLAPAKRVEAIRTFWLEAFTNFKPAGRVTWGPYLGHANHIGYSSDAFQCLYRACDFLWNDPLHAETRDTCIRMHALRNLILDEDPTFGLKFTDARSGIFVTASYYPAGSGHMAMHDDGVPQRKRLIHSLLPITIKGQDYKDGGMLVVNRQGERVDVDSLIEPGDVVFYDGSLKHEVVPVTALPGKTLGRLQVFPIPTLFRNIEDNVVAIARIPVSKILAAKQLLLKNYLRLKLGLDAAIR